MLKAWFLLSTVSVLISGYIPDIRPSMTPPPQLANRAENAIVPTGTGQIGVS